MAFYDEWTLFTELTSKDFLSFTSIRPDTFDLCCYSVADFSTDDDFANEVFDA